MSTRTFEVEIAAAHTSVVSGAISTALPRVDLRLAEMLNERPRKTLAWRGRAEAYAEPLAVH
jgi:hypothetical protein